MKIIERVSIKATPERVWNWLADPALWTQWNPKVKGVSRSRTGTVVAGEVFEAHFALSHKAALGQVEVKGCEVFHRLTLQHWLDVQGRAKSLRVEFELLIDGANTRVVQTTDFSNAGLPWPITLMIHLLHRFGRPVGRSHLDDLKQLAEGSTAS